MKITIATALLDRVKDSICGYIQSDLKFGYYKEDIRWLNDFCDLYKRLRDVNSEIISENQYCIELSSMIVENLPDMINRYIYAEISDIADMDEEDMDWLAELMSIYNQCLTKKDDNKVSEISNTSSDKKNNQFDQMDNCQNLKEKAATEQAEEASEEAETEKAAVDEVKNNDIQSETAPVTSEDIGEIDINVDDDVMDDVWNYGEDNDEIIV